MKTFAITRRLAMVAGSAALLGACSIIPRGADVPSRPIENAPLPEPTETGLPQDQDRHRIALLVPMSGDNGAVGQSIANATTMAILDTNASNLRITAYDTSINPRDAARRALADGNKLILGPLMGENVGTVLSEARRADVPLISFSNDASIASPDVFVMGQIPEQSIRRSVEYAREAKGVRDFAVVVPEGEYGRRAEAALQTAVADFGGRVVGQESYARGNTSVVSAMDRLVARGGFGGLLIADSARLATQAAGRIKPGGAGNTLIIGTELWSGDASVTRASALRGAIFSAVSDDRYRRFVDSYEARFGAQPYRISTLGYDAVLLTLRVARDWRVGRDFPTSQLRDSGGFVGLDGPFRFGRNGVVERAFEVREIRNGQVVVVDPAPNRFDD
ncbi:ABC transporter substrate-binding protein [Erythrobacter sp. HI0063]|jgi:ABC-type branched-subunit amino acid transport system substrate-binding protein|uniref:penicillin-binding protein activator n=1 Tax=Erythrobacter sp. HI0063 TaxID=1822240 RepID=UPI0007C3144E|nr:penicillin-binding protein activator [Erythrobacter sp. HI0063]KZY57123.1 ABC transporter substrate-binding protein [Erythrobacter sp. HI0063]